ncbi:alpha/beta fold hydrolase [Streptomyces sp. NPDC053069]|uniref:thioesterase domain-containing protein n=1 Tax=Streptomyces sp. NPDC053069 TaxID=3365695 RepID=UPI0037D856E4
MPAEQLTRSRRTLVRLRGTTGRPLLFVHPSSGSAGGFRRLLPHLAPGYPVAAFEATEPGPPDECSVRRVAESYLAEAAEAGLVEGAALVGWSFGGVVAVEMARIAERAGHRIGSVVLLDSATPDVLATRPRSAVQEYAGLFGADPEALRIPGTEDNPERILEAVAGLLSRESGIAYTAADLRPYAEVHAWHVRALQTGPAPAACQAPVTLLRAAQESAWGDVPEDLGWSALLGRPVRTRWVPGTHHSLTEQRHAASLAGLLEELVQSGPRTCADGPPAP